jgi:hypothetical protein
MDETQPGHADALNFTPPLEGGEVLSSMYAATCPRSSWLGYVYALRRVIQMVYHP